MYHKSVVYCKTLHHVVGMYLIAKPFMLALCWPIQCPITLYHIAQLYGEGNIGEFGEFCDLTAIRQYFTYQCFPYP